MSTTDRLADDLLRAVARLNRWATGRADLPVPYAQARLLSLLDDHGPSRVSDLARLDHVTQPTATAQVDRLVGAGWAARRPDPRDARATLVGLTPQGRAALDRVRSARAAAAAPALDRLDDADRALLREAVGALDRLLAADPRRTPREEP